MAALGIAERRLGPVTVLDLTGRLVVDDGDTTFIGRIKSLVASGQTNLLVNLGRVTYIDSGGVGALVSMFLHVGRRGGRLSFTSPTERVKRVLHMTRLVDVFEVFDDEGTALRSLAFPRTPGVLAKRLVFNR